MGAREMRKVNSLYQDKQERKIAEWLKANPGKDEEDAYNELYPDDWPIVFPPWEEP